MADGSIRINTKIDKRGAEQGLKELKKDADTKVKQLEKEFENSGKEVDKLNRKFSQSSQEIKKMQEELIRTDNEINRLSQAKISLAPDGKIKHSNIDEYTKVNQQLTNMKNKRGEILGKIQEENILLQKQKSELDKAKQKYKDVSIELDEHKNKQADVNSQINTASKKTQEFANKMKNTSKNTRKVSVESLGISKNLGGAVKRLAKYGVALLGFRGIYGMLKTSMSEWLSGTDKEAKQLNADLSNVKNNIASALAPAIQSVLQIFYKILAVVGAVVKAFSNINIFAKHTAKNTSKTASNSKETSNNLAGFDNLDVLSKDTSGGGRSEGKQI